MTFEEFFTKKKIDLKALKAADEPLFEEFRAHYSAMGEKSFDHSKKFWFNKLRKSYHLAEEETVVIKKPIQTDPVEKAPAATDATAAKPAGFKPRFKATTPTTEPAEQKEEPKTEPSTAAANSTAGFKPRFKPGITKNTATSAEETSAPTDLSNDTAPETAKPTGFKPRFKPGVTKVAEAGPANSSIEPQQENIAETDATAVNKPAGFKPRFKAGVTKTENTDSSSTVAPSAADTSEEQTAARVPEATPTDSNTANPTVEPQQHDDTIEEQTVTSKPTGFKPRFKAGITKTASTDSSSTVVPSVEDTSEVQTAARAPEATPTDSNTANPTDELQQNDNTTQEQTATSKPTGFKPRFKAGLTKIDKKEE
ncbi:hypothetical protein [Sphingobacterium sp. GVS05A]|uniref:hypothetical protein n=1 Tax=Sphingobacterium TaxID=28453 RepID=UPI001CC1555A|nr:hypothetical protein [Sphingobacterium sp. GVS05A]